MFLESFRHIIEIEALKKQNSENHKHILSENKRISDLVERRNKTTLKIEQLKIQEKNLKLHESQQHVEDLQAREKKLTAQLALSVTEKEQNAFENQIRIVKDEREKAEAVYFENLTLSEEIHAEIEDLNEFLNGSSDTLITITKEVELNIANEEKIISDRLKRIAALVDDLQANAKSLYLEIEKKPKLTPTVAFVLGKNCSQCHIQIDSLMKSALEQGSIIDVCPNCNRFLIPETAKLY